MKTFLFAAMAGLIFFVFASNVPAHFGAVIPSEDIVSQEDGREITLSLKFIHPFEGHYMEMKRPRAFGVLVGGKKEDLLPELKEKKVEGASAWEAAYEVRRPGDHVFYMEPEPYWEPSEETFIVHYAKVVVNALGLEEGWDFEAGLECEILPLTRPYGLWAGNVFQGVVKSGGRPVPNAAVEVEYLNEGGGVKAPKEPYVTQVLKADGNGVFTYAMPKAGWWGFAALLRADRKIPRGGREYPVETGAVLWVRTREMK